VFQWRHNGANVPAATNATFSRSGVQPSEGGNYDVVVTNALGAVTSVVARLTVLIPPTITNQPVNLTAARGQSVTLSIGASGDAPLHYQWRFNSAALSGATNASLLLTNVQSTNAGVYSVIVSNVAGMVQSSNATLTVVGMAPTIIQVGYVLIATNATTNSVFQFSFQTEAGVSYLVEQTDGLEDPDWEVAVEGTIDGDGTIKTFQDHTVSFVPQRFFRIRLESEE
jgi:hypothetical protein